MLKNKMQRTENSKIQTKQTYTIYVQSINTCMHMKMTEQQKYRDEQYINSRTYSNFPLPNRSLTSASDYSVLPIINPNEMLKGRCDLCACVCVSQGCLLYPVGFQIVSQRFFVVRIFFSSSMNSITCILFIRLWFTLATHLIRLIRVAIASIWTVCILWLFLSLIHLRFEKQRQGSTSTKDN